MEGSPSTILLVIFLILLNGFFTSAETAIISINKTKISLLADVGNKKAILLLKLLDNPSDFLATIQIGITFTGFFASTVATLSISLQLSEILAKYIPYSTPIAFIIIISVVCYFSLLFGQLIPKRIALNNSEKIALGTLYPIIIISKTTKPFVWILSTSASLILNTFSIKNDKSNEKISREELKTVVQMGKKHGAINDVESGMIDSIIKFDNTVAKAIMTPRTETFSLEANIKISEYIDKILYENYSRIPIYEDDIDNIVGILYMKDLFSNIVKYGIDNVYIKDIMRDPCFVPETNTIQDVFKKLKESKNYMALLIDEYGGFSGIITFEDLVEEVVGEISDEFDDDDDEIEIITENQFIVSGLVSITKINETLNLNLKSDSTDTIGGLFLEHLGTVPKNKTNAEVKIENTKLKLINMDDKRIERLMITLID